MNMYLSFGAGMAAALAISGSAAGGIYSWVTDSVMIQAGGGYSGVSDFEDTFGYGLTNSAVDFALSAGFVDPLGDGGGGTALGVFRNIVRPIGSPSSVELEAELSAYSAGLGGGIAEVTFRHYFSMGTQPPGPFAATLHIATTGDVAFQLTLNGQSYGAGDHALVLTRGDYELVGEFVVGAGFFDQTRSGTVDFTFDVIPTPSVAALGLVALMGLRRRR